MSNQSEIRTLATNSNKTATALSTIAGSKGTYFMEVTTAHTGKKFSMLLINTDAVFTTLTITNSVGSSSGMTSQNLTGATISKGISLTPPEGSWFSAVTMSTGTCVGINF